MDKLTSIKIKYNDQTYSEDIPVSVSADNVEWDNVHNLVDVLGNVDVDISGSIQDQIGQLFTEKVSSTDLSSYVNTQLAADVTAWLAANVTPVGSAVVVDSSLTVSGAAADAKKVGNEITDLKADLKSIYNALSSDETPFYVIDKPMETRQYVYKNDNTKALNSGFTEIMQCPKVLSWNIPSGTSRLYLYIGDIVNNEFVLDTNYIFSTTSGGVYNYLNDNHCITVETNGTKYFYYSKVSDQGIEIIGADYFPEVDPAKYTFSPWWSANDGTPNRTNNYNSVFIPAGCFYAISAGVEGAITVAVPAKSNDFRYTVKGKKRFGYIDEDDGYGLIRFPNATDLTTVKIYTSTKWDTDIIVGRNRIVNAGILNVIKKFKWQAKAEIPWSDSQNTLKVGKNFYGIPYSSRWEDAHHVGIEVSIETALNAANDEYSIFYDLTPGRTAIGPRGGPAYGCVCSSIACLVSKLPYPQTLQGMTYDSNFKFAPSSNIKKGDFVMGFSSDGQSGHIAYLYNVFEKGYSVFEEYQPCVGITTHTGKNDYRMGKYTTQVDYLDSYDYIVNIMRGAEADKQFTNYDVTLANGSVRPWRGNKSVYSNADGFVGITIHGNVETAYIKKPSGTIVGINVPSGTHVIDIGTYCDEDGTYELYSDISNTKEYFKYITHEAVTLTIDENGAISFSDDDIEYAYILADGFGDNTPLYKQIQREDGPMTVHKNAKYPGLQGNVTSVVNAMAYDVWGRYPVSCTLAN